MAPLGWVGFDLGLGAEVERKSYAPNVPSVRCRGQSPASLSSKDLPQTDNVNTRKQEDPVFSGKVISVLGLQHTGHLGPGRTGPQVTVQSLFWLA